MSTALIQPNILKWARERSHVDIELLAHKLPVKSEKVIEWEAGSLQPTFKQAQKLAKILHIPFGYFFLKTPPGDNLPVPDLRTVSDQGNYQFSVDLRDVVANVLRKQDWYHDYLVEEGHNKIPFIGKFSISSDTNEIAKDITAYLRLSVEERSEAHNWEQFLRMLMDRCENAGLWVMRNGKVGNNTHRILDVDEFRGFTICDDYAPVIFLNGADAKAAQIFTLVHELAHLWLGESGVSDIGMNFRSSDIPNKIEKKCNEIAAEFLVPGLMLKDHWKAGLPLENNAEDLSSFFRVSSIVIARRLLDLKLVSFKEFISFYQKQVERWRREKENRPSGGSFYRTMPVANGQHFTNAVMQSVFKQRTLMRDGARLLDTNPVNLEELAHRTDII